MFHFNDCELSLLWRELSRDHLAATVDLALEEDGAAKDVTSQSLCDSAAIRVAHVVARADAVCAGLGLVEEFVTRDSALKAHSVAGSIDGESVVAGASLLRLEAPLTSILPIERVLLNLLGIAMATSTITAKYVEAVAGTKAKVCDTRKTIPGLRWLQKYAVRCGGGHLHRWSLADALLVKDNHIAGLSPSDYARRIRSAVEDLRARNTPLRFVCAEADTMEQFEALLSLPDETLTIALLDNFSLDSLKHAVELRNRLRPSMLLEASGGVRLETIGSIARTGVDRISVGALTHSAGWLDVGLDMAD